MTIAGDSPIVIDICSAVKCLIPPLCSTDLTASSLSKKRLLVKNRGKIMNIFNTIAEWLAERVDCPVTEITPETEFASLGLDSLDLAELLIELESRLEIEIEIGNRKITNVGDVVALVGDMKL